MTIAIISIITSLTKVTLHQVISNLSGKGLLIYNVLKLLLARYQIIFMVSIFTYQALALTQPRIFTFTGHYRKAALIVLFFPRIWKFHDQYFYLASTQHRIFTFADHSRKAASIVLLFPRMKPRIQVEVFFKNSHVVWRHFGVT